METDLLEALDLEGPFINVLWRRRTLPNEPKGKRDASEAASSGMNEKTHAEESSRRGGKFARVSVRHIARREQQKRTDSC